MQLRRIIFWRTTLLLTAMSAIIGVFYLLFTIDSYREESRTIWRARAAVLAVQVNQFVLWDDRVALRQLLLSEVRGSDVLAYAFIVRDREAYVSTFGQGIPLALLQRKPPDDQPSLWEFQDQRGRVMYDITAPIEGRSILHLGVERAAVDRKLRPLIATIVLVCGGTMAAGVALCMVLARQTTREVDQLVEALLIYGEVGEKEEAAIHPSSSEVSSLIQSFKRLSIERRQAEQKIRQLNAELERRVRQRTAQLTAANQELDAFAYSVSHDLRSPLRGIDGFSLALLEDCGNRLDETGKDYLQRIRNGCARMGRLIDDLLYLSRITRGNILRQSVDLSAMVQAVADERQQTEPWRDVHFSIDTGVVVQADPQLMHVVVDNLVGNAWKFTGRKTHAEIVFGARKQDTAMIYFLRDNGAGFDMQYANKLFNAFQRLHKANEFEGSGIGLATVQRVISRHEGRIWAEGAVGEGATFFFTLGEES